MIFIFLNSSRKGSNFNFGRSSSKYPGMCFLDLLMIVFHSFPLQYLGQGSLEQISCYSIPCILIILLVSLSNQSLSDFSLIFYGEGSGFIAKIYNIVMKAVPAVFYGTAWKKDKTADLVELALRTGFRGIDTACQPKHYNEPGVGEGIARSGIPRSQLFIQTKYTPFDGQDPKNIPYNPKDSIQIQVRTSLEVSLKNLKTQYLDSLVLHSPLKSLQGTLEVWNTFEQFVQQGKVKHLGISNCYSYDFFKQLYQSVKVKPFFLQNRFYDDSGYDVELRKFCLQNNIHYQSFWTLTANPHVLANQQMKVFTKKYNMTSEQIFYCILIDQGIIPLIGTCSKKHMEEDLSVLGKKIEPADKNVILSLLK